MEDWCENSIDELEKLSTKTLTDDEMNFIQIKETIWSLEEKLKEIQFVMCQLVTKVSNVITVLNDLDTTIKLHEK